MSTKIDSTPSLPPSTSPLSSARLAAKSAYVSTETGSAGARSRDDTVHITGDAIKMQSLEKTLSGSGAFDAGRVAELRQAIADGRYQLRPERIAARLIDSEAQLG